VSLLAQAGVPLADKEANQVWRSTIMRQRAEFQEVYVRFVPLSPERVKRTTVADGLSAVWTILRRRVAPPPAAPPGR
jgi:hypothetical protein